MDEMNNNSSSNSKVEKVSLSELRAAMQNYKTADNTYLEEQKKREQERKLKQQEEQKRQAEHNQEFQKNLDEFFDALEAASPEDRDGFFQLLEEDMKKNK